METNKRQGLYIYYFEMSLYKGRRAFVENIQFGAAQGAP